MSRITTFYPFMVMRGVSFTWVTQKFDGVVAPVTRPSSL
jgi:hypothetical protein